MGTYTIEYYKVRLDATHYLSAQNGGNIKFPNEEAAQYAIKSYGLVGATVEHFVHEHKKVVDEEL